MAYSILNTDGTTLVLLADKKIDQVSTSLTLVGKNYAGYGEYLNNNLVKLLANSANTTVNPPRNPLKGQLWYDTTAKRLKVYDESFKPVSGALVSSSVPANLSPGDLWFDSTNEQLKIYSNDAIYLVGPVFPVSVGENGWTLPPVKVRDKDNNVKDVTLLKNYGQTLGYMSGEAFTINTSSSFSYLTNLTTTTVKGVTILGDVNASGKIMDRYLSMNIDLSTLISGYNNVTVPDHFTTQTAAIIKLLKSVYPVNDTTSTQISYAGNVNTSVETGVPVGSEARVLCQFNTPLPGGVQVRRFKAVGGARVWDMVTFTNVTTLSNVISTVYFE